MGRKAKVNGKKTGRGKLLWPLLVMLLLTVALAGIGGALMDGGIVPEERMSILAEVCVGVVSLGVSAVMAAKAQEKKLLQGMIAAGAYAALLILGNLLFFGVEYDHFLPILLTVHATGVAGSILGGIKKKKRKFV